MHSMHSKMVKNSAFVRPDGRAFDLLRPVRIERGVFGAAPGRVLVSMGNTIVWCTAHISAGVPAWLTGQGRGWLTAEYSMLPGSTLPRSERHRQKVDGRTTEIQRLIGRSLRAVLDLSALGERTVTIDCDVLQADGGTRTASITGAWVALVDALASIKEPGSTEPCPLRSNVAAVSVGLVHGHCLVDLSYAEDVAAAVDMNVVMTGQGDYVEVQGTGEECTFSARELNQLLALAQHAIRRLTEAQRSALHDDWPFSS